MWIHILLCAVLALGPVAAQNDYPPAGVYIVVDQHFAERVLVGIFKQMWHFEFEYNGTSSNGLTYELVVVSPFPNNTEFYYEPSSSAPNDIVISQVGMYAAGGYFNACDANACEASAVKIVATDVKLSVTFSMVEGNMTLSNPTAELNGTDVMVYCNNTNQCKVPSSEISAAIQEDLSDIFVQGLTIAIKKMSTQLFQLPLVITSKRMFQDVAFNYQIYPYGSQHLGAIITFPLGGYGVVVDEDTLVYPPFEPEISLPDSFPQTITHAGNVVYTEYYISSLIWSWWKTGKFNTIINSEWLSQNSGVNSWKAGSYNVTLQASNPFFLVAVPGLSAHPDMYIALEFDVPAVPQATIDPEGVHLSGVNISVTFVITSSAQSRTGTVAWTMNATVDFDFVVVAASQGSQFDYSKSTVTILDLVVGVTNVGDVSIPMMQDFWEGLSQTWLHTSWQTWYSTGVPVGMADKPKLTHYNGYSNLAFELDPYWI